MILLNSKPKSQFILRKSRVNCIIYSFTFIITTKNNEMLSVNITAMVNMWAIIHDSKL